MQDDCEINEVNEEYELVTPIGVFYYAYLDDAMDSLAEYRASARLLSHHLS